MVPILSMIVLYLIIQVLLLVSAVAIGFILHWCFPGMSIGHGVLVGMLSTIVSAYILAQLFKVASIGNWQGGSLDDDDDEDDEFDEDDDEADVETLPDVRMSRPLTAKERRQRKGDRR
jgi:hypothetical protein